MVTASGKLLTPMLIFKGKPNGWIVKCEFPEYPEGCVYACQDNAWMDEQVMLQWVEQILKPYVEITEICPTQRVEHFKAPC